MAFTEQQLRDFMAQPVYEEWLAEMQMRVFRDWTNCTDPAERDLLWHRYHAFATLNAYCLKGLSDKAPRKSVPEY